MSTEEQDEFSKGQTSWAMVVSTGTSIASRVAITNMDWEKEIAQVTPSLDLFPSALHLQAYLKGFLHAWREQKQSLAKLPKKLATRAMLN
jgi:hypothetical protein